MPGKLDHIPTDEMVDDYYASLADWKTCKMLLGAAEIAATTAEHEGEDVVVEKAKKSIEMLTERVDGNTEIMRKIAAELFRRGELSRIQEEKRG